MTDYLFDTHACVYALGAPAKLGSAARSALEAVESGRARGWIPAAVAAEIALLRERNRIGIGVPELRTAMEQAPSLQFLTLDLRQIEEFAALASIRDPFDRLIVGACRVTGARLISRDRNLQESKLVRAIWD
jgi:PIN domain nuclease of toxin-antitoxin system